MISSEETSRGRKESAVFKPANSSLNLMSSLRRGAPLKHRDNTVISNVVGSAWVDFSSGFEYNYSSIWLTEARSEEPDTHLLMVTCFWGCVSGF